MNLGFKNRFKEKILTGKKIHTIREDLKDRWKVGKTIHFCTGMRTEAHENFHKEVVKGIQFIEIDPENKKVFIPLDLGRIPLALDQIKKLAKNDGFDTVEDFWNWFEEPFKGKIIHWTNLKY